MATIKEQIEQEAVELYSNGLWEGRASAVILAKKYSIASTSEILRLSEEAIAKHASI